MQKDRYPLQLPSKLRSERASFVSGQTTPRLSSTRQLAGTTSRGSIEMESEASERPRAEEWEECNVDLSVSKESFSLILAKVRWLKKQIRAEE